MNTILETENLRKEFFLSYFPKRTILACDDINVSIKEGEVVGQGTGDLKNHLDFIKENNIILYVSGMSAKARGYDDSLLNGFNAEFAMPDKLLELSSESDSVLCY